MERFIEHIVGRLHDLIAPNATPPPVERRGALGVDHHADLRVQFIGDEEGLHHSDGNDSDADEGEAADGEYLDPRASAITRPPPAAALRQGRVRDGASRAHRVW